VIANAALFDGVVGTAYSESLSSTGGLGNTTWTVVSGSLPQGIGISSAGVLSGTPTTVSTTGTPVTIQVQDSSLPPQKNNDQRQHSHCARIDNFNADRSASRRHRRPSLQFYVPVERWSYANHMDGNERHSANGIDAFAERHPQRDAHGERQLQLYDSSR